MPEAPEHCPTHGRDEPGWEWPCPESCPHFLIEVDRAIKDVTEGGNYFKYRQDVDGGRWSQEYRNHQPYGEPRPRRRPNEHR